MAKGATKVPVKSEKKTEKKAAGASSTPEVWRPFDSLRREVDRLFEDFDRGAWRLPFRRSALDLEPIWRHELTFRAAPAVDIVEKDKSYEISAELPGIDEKNIEVKLLDGALTIKGERSEEKEEKDKGYYLKERHFGSFERRFRVPEGVDEAKIEASFKNGLLKVTLPKKPEAKKPAKSIKVSAA